MDVGSLQTKGYRTDYAGYAATGNKKIDNFYAGLSSAVEKSYSEARGDVLGLTMIKYDESVSYGMSAFYSTDSTEENPIIRVSSNYGGEQRYYDVHVKDVNPKNASQLEMFALSNYLDDKGVTNSGTYGSYNRMKIYAINAFDNGYGVDLQDSENASAKIDWVSMLQKMSEQYMKSSQTYSQYLDCNQLASQLENWSDINLLESKEKSDFSEMVSRYSGMVKDKIENGETKFQIGAQSFTLEEWDKMVEKLDEDIDAIKEEQKQRLEKEKEKAERNTAAEKSGSAIVTSL